MQFVIADLNVSLDVFSFKTGLYNRKMFSERAVKMSKKTSPLGSSSISKTDDKIEYKSGQL